MPDIPRTIISAEIDYDKAGKTIGVLRLPSSTNRAAYGSIPIPIAVVRNGSGPTVYLQAGNHGDEYEGQVYLAGLIRSIDPAKLSGRLIIAPAINLPAARAGTRTSPLDGGNLNRAFPGDPNGGPTDIIADYVANHIMPMADVFIDLHSGGSTLLYWPVVLTRLASVNRRNRECLEALRASGAPRGLVTFDDGDTRYASYPAMKGGAVALSGEYGSAGQFSIEGHRIISDAIANLLDHFGVMKRPPDMPPRAQTQLIETVAPGGTIWADRNGVFAPAAVLGESVEAGQVAGTIWNIEDPASEPLTLNFPASGMVLSMRAPAQCQRGDMLVRLARPYGGGS